ncbi:hypothetical protein J7T55_013066 [Diaporthe amygdali]|uniref:uncharacterized protein n=1 Tax=Phomopsis amygdali TaxID=1214568 RepID=UPI0022FE724D|nr:uncharacterized protein J7T55_013066 [Diaporthe amygdali]KAJ0118811.1 hypothetical protein J7T55_013066 [Diaporthe amygdali]
MASKTENGENDAAPGTPKAAGGGYSSLTTREQEILAKAMTCLKTAPEIDFPKLALELGMTNPRSAVNAWSTIKKKMDWTLKAPDTPAGGKTTGAGKRKKAVSNDEEADDDDEAGGPVKKARVAAKPRKKAPATPKKGKAAAAKSPVVAKDDSEEDEIETEDKADSKADVKDNVKEEQDNGEV